MKEIDLSEIEVDEEPQFEPTDDGTTLYFVKCPHCGEEHNLEIYDDQEFSAYDFWCSCTKHFKVEYLPGIPNEKLIVY